jgi:hypothetical protein
VGRDRDVRARLLIITCPCLKLSGCLATVRQVVITDSLSASTHRTDQILDYTSSPARARCDGRCWCPCAFGTNNDQIDWSADPFPTAPPLPLNVVSVTVETRCWLMLLLRKCAISLNTTSPDIQQLAHFHPQPMPPLFRTTRRPFISPPHPPPLLHPLLLVESCLLMVRETDGSQHRRKTTVRVF